MQTYTAHATLRNGLAQQVSVTAKSEIEARQRIFALLRAVSITRPKAQ